MTCGFPKELLALHVEGDLLEKDAEAASNHLLKCEKCHLYLEQLRSRQLMLKSLRREAISPSALGGMRRQVMSAIHDSEESLGWAVRLERALVFGFRRRGYALAGVAILAVLSVSLLAQIRHGAPESQQTAAVFEGKDTLLRPDGYREWVLIGGSAGLHDAGNPHMSNSVYIDRSAYREYAKTGKFPEGTVMVLETAGPQKDAFGLEASVKDSRRFDGGWGFFDFTGTDGKIKPRSNAQPVVNSCRTCHEERAETDHVFTQFYPVLKQTHAESFEERPRMLRSLSA